jgi:hypothetical protein
MNIAHGSSDIKKLHFFKLVTMFTGERHVPVNVIIIDISYVRRLAEVCEK